MGERDPRRRAASFDGVAELYGRYRRPYPAAVVAHLAASAGLTAGSRVLEIGCGTGQLSVPLAERGVCLLAVEMGGALARIARQRLARFPDARVEVAAFEAWPLPGRPFDAVVCANAFHWLDPAIRVGKSLGALRAGGTLAVVHPHHVAGPSPGFFADTNKIYIKWGLSDDPDWAPAAAAAVAPVYPEIEREAGVEKVARHRFEVAQRFTTASYVGLLQTDSLILGLAPEARQGFLDDIAQLVASRYGGEVWRNFVYEVVAARKA